MKQYKSMRGVNIDLAKLMAKAEKSIAVGNTQMNARGDPGRGGRVIKSADEIARIHNANNPVVKSSIKVDNELDTTKKKNPKQEVDDWEEPS